MKVNEIKDIHIRVKRDIRSTTFSLGNMYINDELFCNTMEDCDRGLTQNMTKAEIAKVKKMHITAIPTGTYEVTLSVKSPKHSTSAFYKEVCDGYVPRLVNVPGFDGILIEVGNTDKDSSGCILVGERNKQGDAVLNSRETFKKLYRILKQATGKITITIE